jgi:hypothetical protein
VTFRFSHRSIAADPDGGSRRQRTAGNSHLSL